MVTYMNDTKIRNLDDVRAFLAGSAAMEFSITDKAERYRWIEQTLRRFQYPRLGRSQRGVLLRYLQRVSGYSRQTVTRLVAQYQASGKLQRRQRTLAGFVRYYSDEDTRLLAELDELHATPCGAAAKKLCERMYRVHGDGRYAALSHISVSHLYNLRKATGYRRQRRHFDKTRPTRSQIAQRRKPDPQGQPGYLSGYRPSGRSGRHQGRLPHQCRRRGDPVPVRVLRRADQRTVPDSGPGRAP
jgi:hypothetical protein